MEEKVYFKILLRSRLKDHWWFYAILFTVVFWNLSDFGEQTYSTIMVALGITYPFISFLYLYYWAVSEKNRPVYLPREMEFDKEFMEIKVADGTVNRIPFKRINKSIETRTFFLLYFSRSQFVYVPKNSFKREQDIELFHEYIQDALHNANG